MISSTSCNADFKRICKTALHRPERAGQQWKGVKHGELIVALSKAAQDRGWLPRIGQIQGHLSRDGADLACSFDIEGPPKPPEVSLSFGLVTSNARRRALRFFAGGVCECDEVPIVVQDFLGERYTIDFDVEQQAAEAMDTWVKVVRKLHLAVETLKGTKISQSMVDSILFATGRQKIVPWSRIGRMDHEYRKRTASFGEYQNGWTLLRCFNNQISRSPAPDQMGNTLRFCQLVLKGPAGVIVRSDRYASA